MNPTNAFFYTEPFTYMKVGARGVLIINLLDDKAFLFKDELSVRIANDITGSPLRTVPINEDEMDAPLVKASINNFLGDIVYADSQPLQYYSEINEISGRKAIERVLTYTQLNLGSYISECTVFTDMTHPDVSEYITYLTGIWKTTSEQFCSEEISFNSNILYEHIRQLIQINPAMEITICGINKELIIELQERFPTIGFKYVLSYKTALADPSLINMIVRKKLRHSILIDSTSGASDGELFKNDCCELCVKVSGQDEIEMLDSFIQKGYRTRFCPVLSTENVDFIKSLIILSEEDILKSQNKLRSIKLNNVINSNLWGKVYSFPNGSVYFSLFSQTIPCVTAESRGIYDNYAIKLRSGVIDWLRIRNYDKCIGCQFQYLCPSPTYIESYLREHFVIDCLIEHNTPCKMP